MTLEEFRATGRDAANLDDEPHNLGTDLPGRVYVYDGGPFIERWEDDRHGIAPPNGPTWLLTIGNEQWHGELSGLEAELYSWACAEGIIEFPDALAPLSAELEAYCQHEGLPLRCAEELLHEELTDRQRHWISDFVTRWNDEEAAGS